MIETIKNNEYGQLRILRKDNSIYLVAIDVANALIFKSKASKYEAIKKVGGKKEYIKTTGGEHPAYIISISAFDKMVAMSEYEDAQAYREWVYVKAGLKRHSESNVEVLMSKIDAIDKKMNTLLKVWK